MYNIILWNCTFLQIVHVILTIGENIQQNKEKHWKYATIQCKKWLVYGLFLAPPAKSQKVLQCTVVFSLEKDIILQKKIVQFSVNFVKNNCAKNISLQFISSALFKNFFLQCTVVFSLEKDIVLQIFFFTVFCKFSKTQFCKKQKLSKHAGMKMWKMWKLIWWISILKVFPVT